MGRSTRIEMQTGKVAKDQNGKVEIKCVCKLGRLKTQNRKVKIEAACKLERSRAQNRKVDPGSPHEHGLILTAHTGTD